MKVSVIVTTYNSEKTIERAIESVLNQTGYKKQFDIQLIVVDDCSTDGTFEIVGSLPQVDVLDA